MADFFRRTAILPGTAYVVASDAPAATRRMALIEKARFGNLIQICDGAADNVEIQAAIDALYPTGGLVHLSEGIFSISAEILLHGGVHIQGCGVGNVPRSTRIYLADLSNCNIIHMTGEGGAFSNHGGVSNLEIHGNSGNQASGHAIVIDNATGIRADVRLHDVAVVHVKEDGLRISTGWFHRVSNCCFENAKIGVHLIGACFLWVINTNITLITQNAILSENLVGDFQMIGGMIHSKEHSVIINNSDHMLFNGVTFDGQTKVAATWDDIYIENVSKNVRIQGCFFDGVSISRYAVNIQDTSDFVFVANNYVKDHTAAQPFNIVPGANQNGRIWEQRSDLFMDVLAVSAAHVRSNEDLSAATPITFTIDTQPDVPRTLSGHFDSHAQITAYTIVITGVDAKGITITETKTEASGWDWETSNAFATITSIIMTARTGTGVGDTMDIGITDVLGLSTKIYATNDVYKIKKNNANAVVAVAQVNATYGTYDMAVIGLTVGDDFTIWYRSNLNIVS